MKVGSLVECQEDIIIKDEHVAKGVKGVAKNTIYTIRNIKVVFHANSKAEIYIIVEEVVNPKIKCECGRPDCEDDDEVYFDIRFFRGLPNVNINGLF